MTGKRRTFAEIMGIVLLFSLLSCNGKSNCKTLSESEASRLVKEETAAFLERKGEELKPMWDKQVFTYQDLSMPVKVRVLGDKPEDGRSLYISMHGGGNAPEELNNQQWENQIALYSPAEGVYVAPRAPFNDWNMWFRPEIDPLFESLILAAVIEMDVNPDKVYLMGYSAGGDGVWRLAPRMADRWAAASMMAGHPGEASLLNLRNLPFMIWMGENDEAYNRNGLAVVKGRELDSLQKADPAAYIHETHIVEGKGHWMDREDAYAVEWMPQFKRNPFPDQIVWRQEEVVRSRFYWLEVDPEEARHGMTVRASHDGNDFTIAQCDYARISICLNDQLADLDQPVTVHYGGRKIFEGKVPRQRELIRASLEAGNDIRMVYTAKLELVL